MFWRVLDKWLYEWLNQQSISTKPSGSRWGITQIVLGFSLFLIASAIAFVSLSFSLWGIHMVVAGWFALGFAIVCFGTGVFAICYMVHLGKMWLKDQGPSPELEALNKLTSLTEAIANKLGVNVQNYNEHFGIINTQIREELKRIKNKGEGKNN